MVIMFVVVTYIYTPNAGIFLTIGQYTRTHEVQHNNLYCVKSHKNDIGG